jgi:hypothetical protein
LGDKSDALRKATPERQHSTVPVKCYLRAQMQSGTFMVNKVCSSSAELDLDRNLNGCNGFTGIEKCF